MKHNKGSQKKDNGVGTERFVLEKKQNSISPEKKVSYTKIKFVFFHFLKKEEERERKTGEKRKGKNLF